MSCLPAWILRHVLPVRWSCRDYLIMVLWACLLFSFVPSFLRILISTFRIAPLFDGSNPPDSPWVLGFFQHLFCVALASRTNVFENAVWKLDQSRLIMTLLLLVIDIAPFQTWTHQVIDIKWLSSSRNRATVSLSVPHWLPRHCTVRCSSTNLASHWIASQFPHCAAAPVCSVLCEFLSTPSVVRYSVLITPAPFLPMTPYQPKFSPPHLLVVLLAGRIPQMGVSIWRFSV